jgi:ribosome-binding protein aMBF1 (putative translation factor)
MTKLVEFKTNEEVLIDHLSDPAFRAEWDRTAVARSLALQVTAFRAQHDLSQRAMADLLKMSQPQVARIEAAEHNPDIETLSRVADVMGVELQLTIPPNRQEPKLLARAVVS